MTHAWQAKHELLKALGRVPHVFYAGKVTRVIGLIIEGFLPRVPVGALCEIHMNLSGDKVQAEVIGLKGELAVLMPIGSTSGIQVGDEIVPIRNEVSVKVSDQLLGRILDGRGMSMDGHPLPANVVDYPLYNPIVPAIDRQLLKSPLPLGVRALDGFMTVAQGQRMAIMAGSGVGKSTLLGMMARNAKADVNVIGLIGERGREVREFIENDLGPEGLKRSVVIVATSDEPPLVRMRAAFVATSIAEYFRDKGKKVLLMMDSLTRFAMATREVGLSLGEPPTVKGYTPSLFSTLPKLLERVGTTSGDGNITGLYTILTEGDDLQDPIADAVRAIVDGHIVLSRKLNNMGHYPPIEILHSLSRVMRGIVDPEHFAAAVKVRGFLSLYTDMEDYIKIGVYQSGKNPALDLAVSKIEELKTFLKQSQDETTSFEETVSWVQKMAMEG